MNVSIQCESNFDLGNFETINFALKIPSKIFKVISFYKVYNVMTMILAARTVLAKWLRKKHCSSRIRPTKLE